MSIVYSNIKNIIHENYLFKDSEYKKLEKNKTCHLNILLGHRQKFFHNMIINYFYYNTVNVQTLCSIHVVTP